jgi:hypothetical protein
LSKLLTALEEYRARRSARKLRVVKKTIFQAALLLAFAARAVGQTPRPAQVQPSTLSIHVSDELGAVIGRAFVLLHADALERENPKPFNLEVRTNSEGDAKALIPPGFYDVFVTSTGFAPQCQKLRVRVANPVAIKFVLKVDKLMSDEYADPVGQP